MIFDCPSLREFVVQNFPCILRGKHICHGIMHPHHDPYKSEHPNNWTDLKIYTLCESGHRWVHDHPEEFMKLVSQREIEERQTRQIEAFISSLVEAGPPIIVERKRKTSTRTNRLPLSKRVGTPTNPLT